MKRVKIIGIVILWINLFHSYAQTPGYLSKMEQVFDQPTEHTHYAGYILEANNPLEFLFAGLFVGYKIILSSQDMDSCVFSPSCSVYGIESIKQKGILLGTLNTFDRLTRCHPFAGDHYVFDPGKNKYYDPVD